MTYKTPIQKKHQVKDLFNEYSVGAKPFLKWAGGKGQLLSKFRDYYPSELKNNKIISYFEPFIGGGAVFFDIAQNFKIESAYLYDINEELILAYRVIQKDVNKLMEFLYRYEKQYHILNEKKQSEYYKGMRETFNYQRFNIDYDKYSELWVPRAAQIIFLNKTCFNGLFRFNSKGEFNVPIGRYKNPKILNEINLKKVSKVLGLATIKRADFRSIHNDIRNNSFIYYDPPYRPISKTSSFTSYSKHQFRDKEQVLLADTFSKFNCDSILQMLSNSDPKNYDKNDNFFDELYKDYYISRVPAKRMINSVASKRSAVSEIIVTNYKV